MAGADDGDGLIGGKMRKRFFEGPGKSGELRAGPKAQNGFANTVDAMSGGFEGLSHRVMRIASDNDLNGMTHKERGRKTVRGGKQAILPSDSGEGFERFLCEIAVTPFAGESMQSNERNGGNGIPRRCGRILKGLATDFEPAHRSGVVRAIEKAAILGIAVASNRELHGFLRRGEVARIEPC